jgi:hypothetical protein
MEFKGDGLINLMKEILKQSSIQAVTWLLLTTFSLVYNENLEPKAEDKDLKNLQTDQKAFAKLGLMKA